MVRPKKPDSAFALINRFVRPLQDLLVFALGRPIRLTDILLLPTKSIGTGTGLGHAYFESVQPMAPTVVSDADVYSQSAPTILTLRSCPLSFDQLLPAWFRVWEEHREAVMLLLIPTYAPFIYGGHSFGVGAL